MAVSPVRNILNPDPIQSSLAPTRKAAKQKPAARDTVKISAAANSLQKTTVAPAETVKAASAGDLQAKAQLAKPVGHNGQ